uniref:Uncharacterized protein n=1 Tax=Peronospora matthiolae TaxID=2874970 RepID=A0AAV1V8I4_9STRA
MTAQDHSVEGKYTVEPATGTCVETHAAPKVHHSKRSSGLEHGCTPSRVHPRRESSVVQDEQHVEARSAVTESIVEQAQSPERESIKEDVTVVVHPQSVHELDEISSVPESDNSRESYVENVDPQRPADVFSQEITETVNVLVNDGSSVGAYTLDLAATPKSYSEVIKLPTLESKRFLRDLRSDKIKQICVLVTEDEYVADIRSAQVFAKDERVLSSS